MKGYFVAIIFGDENMSIKLLAEGLPIPFKIDAPMELSQKSRCEGLNMNASMAQLKGEEEMPFR